MNDLDKVPLYWNLPLRPFFTVKIGPGNHMTPVVDNVGIKVAQFFGVTQDEAERRALNFSETAMKAPAKPEYKQEFDGG